MNFFLDYRFLSQRSQLKPKQWRMLLLEINEVKQDYRQ